MSFNTTCTLPSHITQNFVINLFLKGSKDCWKVGMTRFRDGKEGKEVLGDLQSQVNISFDVIRKQFKLGLFQEWLLIF
jgi:hypothetical protein